MIEPINSIPLRPEAVALRPNARLMEALQTQKETSGLLSSLPSQNQLSFQAPTRPEFVPRGERQLLKSFPAGRLTSPFLSSLTSFGQAVAISRASRSSDPLETIRAAQEIMQTVRMAPPSAAGRRIGGEAYLMEIHAQQDYQNQLNVSRAGMREWFA